MNLCLIVWDDLGLEIFNRWGAGGGGSYPYPATPGVDSIVDAGMMFTRFYVQQLCSPCRANVATGRNGQRTGILDIIRDDSDGVSNQIPLGEDEVTLAKLFKAAGYATGCFGKWHLGNTNAGGRAHPNRMGFDTYAGNLFNLDGSTTHNVTGSDVREGYYCWDQTVNGTGPHFCRTYHATQTVNNALRWVREQTRDFFLYVPFYSVHSPFVNRTNVTPNAVNTPPTSLYDSTTWSHGADADQTTTQQVMHGYRAGIEGADHELVRLLAGLPTDTIVIFISDNGSPVTTLVNEVHPTFGAYTNHGKDSPYQTGILTPLAVKGPGISTGTFTGVVSAVDVFSTACDLFSLPIPTDRVIDGISFAGVLHGGSTHARTFHYAEFAQPLQGPPKGDIGKTAIEYSVTGPTSLGQYSLVKNGISAPLELYELCPSGASSFNPMETTNLTPGGVTTGLNAARLSAFNQLKAIRAAQVA